MRRLPVSALVAVVLGACDPYDPDLGDRPFRCDPQSQSCPEGYRAVTLPDPPYCECRRDDGTLPDAGPGGGADGSGMFSCNDDSATEGTNRNDNIQTATPTPIGPMASSSVFNAMAICPATDVDTFSMNVTQAGKRIDVVVQFDQAQGQLAVGILNSAGSQVAQGTPQTNQVRATYTVPVSGTYYAQVKSGGAGVQNNYDIQMQVSGP